MTLAIASDLMATLEREEFREALDRLCVSEWHSGAIQETRIQPIRSRPKLQNAWVSDHTTCYLARGKPVVVRHTGPSDYLPRGEGMFRFRTTSDAAAALDAVNSDYPRHCHAAREIADAHFDARRILTTILDTALAPAPEALRA